MRRRCHAWIGAACCLAGALAGCGSAAPAGLSTSTAGSLRRQLADVQAAAGRGDRAGALDALSAFSGDVTRHAGQLTAAQRAALHTGISRLRQRIDAEVAAPSPTTTTTMTTTTTAPTTTQPTTPAPAPHPDHGNPHGPHGAHGPKPGKGNHGGGGPGKH